MTETEYRASSHELQKAWFTYCKMKNATKTPASLSLTSFAAGWNAAMNQMKADSEK